MSRKCKLVALGSSEFMQTKKQATEKAFPMISMMMLETM